MKNYMLSPNTPVRFRDKLGQALASGSYMYAYVLFSGLAMYFFTDVAGLSAGAVGTMMMVATIWDGINDPLMGLLVDKTHTRWGKARPYILIGSICIAISVVMTFTVPGIQSESGRLAYAYVSYILMGMSITVLAMSAPILMTRLTKDPVKIASLNAWTYAGVTIVSVFASVTLMSFLGIFAGMEQNYTAAYQKLALLAGGISLVAGVAGALLVQERDFDNMTDANYKSHTVKEILSAVLHNKHYLILIVGVVLFMAFYTLAASTHMYYLTYCVGNAGLYSWIAAFDYAGPVIAIFTISYLVQHFDKKNILLVSLLVVAAGVALRLLTGDKNTVVMLVLVFITSSAVGFFSLNATPMLIDTAQYGQLKTGVDASGVIIASFTLAQKIGAGLATGILGVLMEKAGYDGTAEVQPDAALAVIKNANLTCFMLASLASAVIIFFFYKLKRSELDAELAKAAEASTPAAE